MGRRVVIVVAVVVVFVAAGAAFALLRDDGTSDTEGTTTTTTTRGSSTTLTPSTSASTSTSSPTTTGPATTLAPDGVPDCGVDSAAIQAAVNKGVDGASTRAQVDQCRLAAVDTTWAAVRLVAKPGADFAATTVVLHGGGGSWAIVGTGGTAAVCNQTPQQVLVDLGVTCSSGGGI